MLIAQECFVDAGYVNVLLAEEVAECGNLLVDGSNVDVKSVKVHRHHLGLVLCVLPSYRSRIQFGCVHW